MNDGLEAAEALLGLWRDKADARWTALCFVAARHQEAITEAISLIEGSRYINDTDRRAIEELRSLVKERSPE